MAGAASNTEGPVRVVMALRLPRYLVQMPTKLAEVEMHSERNEAKWPRSNLLEGDCHNCSSLGPEEELGEGPAGYCQSTWRSGPLVQLVEDAVRFDSRTNSPESELCS